MNYVVELLRRHIFLRVNTNKIQYWGRIMLAML